jgi:hypothetical protein
MNHLVLSTARGIPLFQTQKFGTIVFLPPGS